MIGVWGGLSFTLFGVFFALGMVFYQYKLWKALKNDLSDKELMGMIWISCFFALLGGRLVFVLSHWNLAGLDFLSSILFWRYAGFSWLGCYFFGVGSIWIYSRMKDWSGWLILEEAVGPFLGWLGFSFLGQFFSSSFSVFSSLGWFLFFSALYFLSYWVAKRYRSWSWYPSGRKGFLFLVSNLFFFSVLLLLDFATKGRLYSVDILYAGWVVFVAVYLVILSEYKLNILNRRKK